MCRLPTSVRLKTIGRLHFSKVPKSNSQHPHKKISNLYWFVPSHITRDQQWWIKNQQNRGGEVLQVQKDMKKQYPSSQNQPVQLLPSGKLSYHRSTEQIKVAVKYQSLHFTIILVKIMVPCWTLITFNISSLGTNM